MNTKHDKLSILRKILLTEDREYIEAIAKKIAELEHTLETPTELSKKVDPLIEQKIEAFVKEVPQKMGPSITKALKNEIKFSREDIVDALYPIIGNLIKKYIKHEIQILSERVDEQLKKNVSVKAWKRKFMAWFGQVKEEEIIISNINTAVIEQVLVIEKDSGILMGSYSKQDSIDEDMISGMLTAIKSFVEDAFYQKDQNLELIEYGTYTLHIQSFASYYVAVVVSGNYTATFKDKLEKLIFKFTKNFISLPSIQKGIHRKDLEKELNYYFKNDIC